jgi:PD-(D/E)XK nuclease superfamily
MTKPLLLDLDPRRGLPSASAMGRLKRCPGSLALSNYVRRNGYFVPQNPYARPGTLIHDWLQIDFQGTSRDQDRVDGIEAELSEDQLGTAHKCAALRVHLVDQWAAESEASDYVHLVERRFWYWLEDIRKFSGQIDLAFVDRASQRALILDYKTGRLESEEAADNYQLRTEVILLKAALPSLEQIDAQIIEPMVTWDNERVRYEGKAFREAEEEILSICDEASFHPKERHAGPWCANCPGRVYCKEASDYVQKIPNFPAVDREKLNGEGESVAKFDQEKLFRDLPRGEQGSTLWRRMKFAGKLLEAYTEAYERILEDEPNALPDFMLPKEGRERRFVPYPARLKAALSKYLTGEEIDGCATYWPAKIEELFGMKHRLSGKELESQFAKLTKGTIETLHDKPFIRPLTKKERAALAEVNPVS